MPEELDSLLSSIRATFDADFEPLQIDGDTLQILTIRNMPAHLDSLLRRGLVHDPLRDLPVWARVWPASFVLGRLLRKYEPEGKSLLELGAGTGLLSMVAARYGFSRIVLSDGNEDALRFARANVLRNRLSHMVETCRMDITRPAGVPCLEDGFDIIAASEVLYLDELHRPLLKIVQRYLKTEGKAMFCTDMARAKPRFAKLAARSFRVTEGHVGVKSTDAEEGEQRRIYGILILEKA